MIVKHRFAMLVTALVLLASAPKADAKDFGPPTWTIQIDPLTTALGFVHVQLEAVIADHWSVYLGPSLHLLPGILAEEGEPDFTGLGAEFGVRYYFEPGAPHGWWALVRGVVAHLSLDNADVERVGGYASVLAGHTWIIERWFVLSAGLGVQYLDYEVGGAGPKGVLPAAHTTLGVAF